MAYPLNYALLASIICAYTFFIEWTIRNAIPPLSSFKQWGARITAHIVIGAIIISQPTLVPSRIIDKEYIVAGTWFETLEGEIVMRRKDEDFTRFTVKTLFNFFGTSVIIDTNKEEFEQYEIGDIYYKPFLKL